MEMKWIRQVTTRNCFPALKVPHKTTFKFCKVVYM